MAAEDEMSRKRERGICNVVGRNGNVCMNVSGECPFHAPENQRCRSMVNGDPLSRCWSYRAAGQFCSNHEDYPDLSVWAKAYADECHQRTQKVGSIEEFRQRYFPSTAAEFPMEEEEFLACLCRISGYRDLWLVSYSPRCDAKVREAAKRIVELLLPFIGDARTNVAKVNHTLSDWGWQLRAKYVDSGFVIGTLGRDQMEVARLLRAK